MTVLESVKFAAGKYLPDPRVKVLGVLLLMSTALVGSASAASVVIDWDVLTGLLANLSSDVVPAMVDFIVSVVPAIVILSVLGFIITFLDKILSIFDKVFK